jgi:hypothetical protein
MKWRKRQREIARLRAQHADRFAIPFPDLSITKKGVPPTSDRITDPPRSGRSSTPQPAGLIVDHFHKSGLQVILKSELPWAGGKKP